METYTYRLWQLELHLQAVWLLVRQRDFRTDAPTLCLRPRYEPLIVHTTVCRAHPCAAGASIKTEGLKIKRQVALEVALAQKYTSQLTHWGIRSESL